MQADNSSSLRDKLYHTMDNFDKMYLASLPVNELTDNYKLTTSDIMTFLPLQYEQFSKTNIQFHFLGHYLQWIPQEAYYCAVENTGFKARSFRTQGTCSKHNSIDDKIDDLHYYTTYIKFGIGRATYDSSLEIRNRHLTREEGCALVKRFDGESPYKYFEEIMDYINLDPGRFNDLCEKFRAPHLWKKGNGKWKLIHTINRAGTDDQ